MISINNITKSALIAKNGLRSGCEIIPGLLRASHLISSMSASVASR